jgi:hypothetical protein
MAMISIIRRKLAWLDDAYSAFCDLFRFEADLLRNLEL